MVEQESGDREALSKKNKAVYLNFIREVLNAGDLSKIALYTAPDFIDHRYLGRRGIEGSEKALQEIRAAFPDIQFNPEDVIAEGDRVVVRFTIRGTHLGKFMGVPPTGKKVTWSGINILRVADGKAIELWGEASTATLMQQLTEV